MVVREVISQVEIEASIDEIWSWIESQERIDSPQVNRNDPRTWENESWPQIRALGILSHTVASRPMSWQNRQNINIYKLFCLLLKRSDLWVAIDRYGEKIFGESHLYNFLFFFQVR